MAYEKQTWDTTSFVNPTRMNHIEEGIEAVDNGGYKLVSGNLRTDTPVNLVGNATFYFVLMIVGNTSGRCGMAFGRYNSATTWELVWISPLGGNISVTPNGANLEIKNLSGVASRVDLLINPIYEGRVTIS